MEGIVRAASALGRAVGAHPGYPDRAGFGRVELAIPAEVIARTVAEQVRALGRIAGRAGVTLAHVKPHGALYHAAMTRLEAARAVAEGASAGAPGAALVGLAGAAALDLWRSMRFRVLPEAFADRRYAPDGSVVPRASATGALITDPTDAAEQALRIADGRGVVASDGTVVPIEAETICVHGDSPGALGIARAVRARLEQAGIAADPPR